MATEWAAQLRWIDQRLGELWNLRGPYPGLGSILCAMGVQYGAADPGETKNARRVAYVIGPDGRIRNVFAKANTASFAADVLALL